MLRAAAYDPAGAWPRRLVLVTRQVSFMIGPWNCRPSGARQPAGELVLVVVVDEKEVNLGSRDYVVINENEVNPASLEITPSPGTGTMRVEVRAARTGKLAVEFTVKGHDTAFPTPQCTEPESMGGE